MSGHVFISYSSQDTVIAQLLENALKKEYHFVVWRDRSAINFGEKWINSLEAGLRHAFALLLLVSDDSIKSHYVTFEWSFAMGRGIPVIPVYCRPKLNESILAPLMDLQFADFSDFERFEWDKLIDSLNLNKIKYENEATQNTSYINVANIVNDLEHGDESQKLQATLMVNTNRIEIPVKYLASNFLDTNLSASLRATSFLGILTILQEKSLPYVLRCIEDDSLDVRIEGLTYVASFLSAEWFDDLLKVAKNTKTFKVIEGVPAGRINAMRMASAISVLDPEQFIPIVIDTLFTLIDDDNIHMVGLAIEYLGVLKLKEAKEKLMSFMDDDREYWYERDEHNRSVYRPLSLAAIQALLNFPPHLRKDIEFPAKG